MNTPIQTEDSERAIKEKLGDSIGESEAVAPEPETQPTTAAFNPTISDDDEQKIRGDAIGDTLYSERFVLSTLLKLTKLDKDTDDEDFEKDLCALWDMTIEESVVLLLLEHNVLELFTECINATDDKRLIEILVGMMGNMCCVERTREQLCDRAEVMATLLGLADCGDSLTLIQLMRLWTVTLMNTDTEDTTEKWFRHFRAAAPNFVQHLSFILSNSTNDILLRQTLEALNAILAKFAVIEPQEEEENELPQQERTTNGNERVLNFSDVFVEEALIKSTTEAFQTLAVKWPIADIDSGDEVSPPSQSVRKIMETFLNIHSILTQYGENIKPSYAPSLPEVISCLNIILEPLCEPRCLLPLSSYEQNVLESLSDVFLALEDPFSERVFNKLITIWQLVEQASQEASEKEAPKPANDFEDDEPAESEVDCENLHRILLDFVSRIVTRARDDQLKQALRNHADQTVHNLLKALDAKSGNATDIKKSCAKMRKLYEAPNGIENAK